MVYRTKLIRLFVCFTVVTMKYRVDYLLCRVRFGVHIDLRGIETENAIKRKLSIFDCQRLLVIINLNGKREKENDCSGRCFESIAFGEFWKTREMKLHCNRYNVTESIAKLMAKSMKVY